MNTKIEEIVNNEYCPQNIKFANNWKASSQSNLSLIAGYNNSNLLLFDKNYSQEMNKMTNNKLETSSSSVWSIRFKKNDKIAIICGSSTYIDLFSNTGNIITSLTV